MSSQRREEPTTGIPTRRDTNLIRNNTHNHSNGQLIGTNRRLHSHKYGNMRGLQFPQENISQYFQTTRDNSKHNTAAQNSDNRQNKHTVTKRSNATVDNTTEAQDTSRLPPCSVGVIRFIHINTGGVCSKQNFVEFKLLLTNMSIAQADIYSVNEINLDTTQKKIKKSALRYRTEQN